MSLTKVRVYKHNVVIYYSYQGKVLRHRVGLKVENPKHFSTDKLFLKSSNLPNYKAYNETILKVQNKIENIILEIQSELGTPDVDLIKQKIESKAEKSIKDIFIVDGFDKFYKYKSNGQIKEGSLKNYMSLFNALKDMDVHYNKKFRISDINNNWVGEFYSFLSMDRRGDKKYKTNGLLNNNTTKKRLKHFKEFYNFLVDENLALPNKSLDKATVKGYKADIVALNEKELDQLISYEAKNPTEQKVIDLFLFGCLTGLRFSDIESLDKQHIIEKETDFGDKLFIQKHAIKTKELFIVPLNVDAVSILKKYNYQLNLFSLAYYNRELKKVLKQIEIFKEGYKYRTYVGNELKERKGPRYEFIGSHVARRTFVSNHVRIGTPINQIMKSSIVSLGIILPDLSAADNLLEPMKSQVQFIAIISGCPS